MGKYKIGVYAICKNEENFVDRWVDSMEEADVIVVCDTGSTDRTIEKLRARGVIVKSIEIKPWRFDTPRNIAMELLPEDTDICVSTDLDEILEPGWRAKVEKVWTPETTRLRYSYTWNFNEDGSRGTTFLYEKIHGRHNFKWIKPVHELLHYSGTEPDIYAVEPSIQLNHYPDPNKSRGQYLDLLELSLEEFPDDDRNAHYLGREYMFRGMYDKAINALKKHLDMPTSTWRNERCASMRFIARCYRAKGDYEEASGWLFRAIAEAPYLREPYAEMALLAQQKSDWPRIYWMVETALKINVKPNSYMDEAFCWNETLYDLGALSCYYMGLFDVALYYAEMAWGMAPEDERLKDNLNIIKRKIELNNKEDKHGEV